MVHRSTLLVGLSYVSYLVFLSPCRCSCECCQCEECEGVESVDGVEGADRGRGSSIQHIKIPLVYKKPVKFR